MLYSPFIYRIAELLQRLGVKVHLHQDDLPCMGVFCSRWREVFINCPTAGDALMTIAHEAGHVLGYDVFGAREHSYQRERQAFVYGWRVLVLVGADRAITRAEWIADELERRAAPDIDVAWQCPACVRGIGSGMITKEEADLVAAAAGVNPEALAKVESELEAARAAEEERAIFTTAHVAEILGRKNYEAYCASVKTTFDGKPLPAWDEADARRQATETGRAMRTLTEAIRQGWIAGAIAVEAAVCG